jgi:tetratricopeptide (TPR) repeat protein
MTKIKSGLIAVLSMLLVVPALAGPSVSFQQAAQDYAAGKYSLALSEFEAYRTAYPTNIQIRYYEALCYQALARLDKARVEYQYVAQNDTGRLKALAETALVGLSKVHSRGSGSSSGSPEAIKVASAGGTTTSGESKVRKVIEFYAVW